MNAAIPGYLLVMRLAWRNLLRKRRRTAMVLLLVAYASATIIVYWGIVDGYQRSVLEVHARYLLAPIQVASAAYFADPDPQNALQSLAVVPDLLGLHQVRALSPRLDFPALLRSVYGSTAVEVRGVDPGIEAGVSGLPTKIGGGHWLRTRGEIVLGHRLAEQLDVRLGERLVLDTVSLIATQALGFELVGLIDAGIATVDQRIVLIHLEDARQLTGLTTATSLALRTDGGRETRAALAIQSALPAGLQARGVWALLGPIGTDIIAAKLSVIPIAALLAIFASIGMSSTILVTLNERSHELSLIEALGCLPRRLAGMVIAESMLVTLLGWVLGCCLGYAIIGVLARFNIIGPIFAASTQVWASAGLAAEFYAAVHPIYLLYALCTVLVGAALSTAVASLYLRSSNLSEGLRA